MQNKRGQFYIVAAIVISIIITSMAGTTTYAYSKSSPSTIQELSSELKQESSKVIDYGVYNPTEEDKLSTFTQEDFADYIIPKTDHIELSLIYGNEEEGFKEVKYDTTDKGTISLVTGGDSILLQIREEIVEPEIPLTVTDNKVTVTILEQDYIFELKPGQNFYFVIQHQEGEESFVTTSEILKK